MATCTGGLLKDGQGSGPNRQAQPLPLNGSSMGRSAWNEAWSHKKDDEITLAKASRFCVLWRKSLTRSMFGVSQFLFDVGPPLSSRRSLAKADATRRVERLSRHAAPRQALGPEHVERASDGPAGTKQAITQNWDAPSMFGGVLRP